MASDIVLVGEIEPLIVSIRGLRVILDTDLAALYGVTAKRLNEQVRRNRKRFPEDFMFQLTAEEAAALRSQNATLKPSRGQHRKYRPYAFSEHGAIMAANVLNSPRAVEVGVFVVRAFVKLRELVATHAVLTRSKPYVQHVTINGPISLDDDYPLSRMEKIDSIAAITHTHP